MHAFIYYSSSVVSSADHRSRVSDGASSRGGLDVSLVICTRNRCQQLARCLESVGRIVFERPWELIIVDNGSVDETASVVMKFVKNTTISMTYKLESKPGKSNALNTAIGMARGEIVAFTDDDCYPSPDFLDRVWSAFEDRSVGYITGRIVLHDPTDAPVTIYESTTSLTFPGGSFIGAGPISGANIAFRRSVLVEIGGFDPFFGPGSSFQAVAEDLDAAGRASAMGWKGQYRPEVIIRHHHGRKAADIPRLVKSYGIGIGAYHMKLLLKGHQFLWFAKSVHQIPKRLKWSRRCVVWESVGAVKYACVYLKQAFHAR
jgi:cellulose synthase/poly-beta-1,6-N-acetylglucosamine synthase-like glycosyltransferase